MPHADGAVQLHQHDSPLGRWRLATLPPQPPLSSLVEAFWEVEGRASYTRDRVLPSGCVDLLVNLGCEQRLVDGNDPALTTPFRTAWVAGLQDRPLTTEAVGHNHVLGIRFRPGGAYAYFGLPLEELSGRVLELDLLLGSEARELRERLFEASSPLSRLRLLEAHVHQRLQQVAVRPRAEVVAALARLGASAGRVGVAALAGELGVSERWLLQRFREQVGLGPKRLARILRFRGVIEHLQACHAIDWTEIAHRFEYFDQPHFNREFRAFAGASPSEFLQRRSPDGTALIVG